ncbi:MAG TPA: hypothetical protein VEC11_14755 [Allosphingosinicella sp.]|nr:hypothetical protein [Allosphingosinicella sp.]
MNIVMAIHIAGGVLALPAGTIAVAARKGGRLHAWSGTLFFGAMLVLGITAALLEPWRNPPGSPIGGLIVCYFVATSWMAARRGDGRTGRFEVIACAAALGLGALMLYGAFTGAGATPVGRGPVFAMTGLVLLAGLLDLNAILRAPLSRAQRLSRHLWRMCFAFFIATGSFFLGQQDVLPAAWQRSPFLLVPAFAPFAVMAFWLVRVRFGRRFRPSLPAAPEGSPA